MSVTVDVPAPVATAAPSKAASGYWTGVWRRLRRDPVTVVCALILVTIAGLAIAAPFVAPADPYKYKPLENLSFRRAFLGRPDGT